MTEIDTDLELLESLVGDAAHFADHHWGRLPLHRNAGATFQDLLTIEGIEELLLGSARFPTFRLVRDGSTLPAGQSTNTVRLGGKDVDGVADVARIAAAVDNGATLVMQGLQRTTLPIARFCRSLERAISHPVQANAYLSPPGSAGLGAHHDDHDVIALQLDGTKRWVIDGLGSLETSSGDVLYIPAGVRHDAATHDQLSLHLTIGIIRVTLRRTVQRALAEIDTLDAPLPLGYARPERATELRLRVHDALRAATTAMDEADPSVVSAAERARANNRRSPLAIGHLGSILRLDSLDQHSRVRWRTDVPAVVELGSGDDQRLVLLLADRRITMPVAMQPAVERLLQGAIVAIGSLPGLDDGSRLVLVRRLVRETVLVLADRPEGSPLPR